MEIKTTLKSDFNFTQHRTYNAYLINIFDLNKTYEFNLTVDGTPGNLINVGSNFHDASKNSISHKEIQENSRNIFGYLKKGTKKKIVLK